MKKIERSVVLGDLHIPFHDAKAVRLTLKFIKEFKPDNIFLNGDILDCWEISKFDKTLSIQSRLIDEVRTTVAFLRNLRSAVPNARIIYIFGNHEFRFERFIARNSKELAGLKGMTMEEQLELKELNIKAIDSHQRENFYRYGLLLIGHFNRVNKHSGYTAKNLLEDKGMSLIQNHTHRGGVSYKRDYRDLKIAVENFCLCNLNPKYCLIPNWQQGFSVIYKETNGTFFKVMPLEIIKYRIFFGNKIIDIK